MIKLKIIRSLFVFILAILPGLTMASDQENCLMCHKYSGMGRYEKTPNKIKKRIFYINEDIFRSTVHGKLRCKDCHVKVDRIPHTDVEKVDCSTDCHIEDPSSKREFSHKRIVDSLKASIHGEDGTKNPKHKADLPTCKYCHRNPVINTGSDAHLAYLNICTQCHANEEWAKRFLNHQFFRMGKRRASKDIVALCGSCHENRRMMERHNLDVIVGFKDTYHGKAITYGNEDVADCLGCHAPRGLGLTPHSIASKTESRSSVNENNRVKTCQNQGGAAVCHPSATKEFALGRKKIHPSGLLAIAVKVVQPGEQRDVSDEAGQAAVDEFHAKVVSWINTIYKILIGVIVGGMIFHQTLDFIAVAKERRREREGGHGSTH